MREAIAARHSFPRQDDLITSLLGGVLDDGLVFETVYTMLAAGVDTSTSILSAALLHMNQYPGQKQALLDNPELVDTATEEFLRFYAPAQATARTAVAEIEVAGVRFQPGERILLAWGSANRDADHFDAPDTFRVDRTPNRHVTFAHGIHRSIGAPLARQELKVILAEVLRRIPDYEVDTEGAPTYPDVGLMFGYQTMPAVFSPGHVEGAPSNTSRPLVLHVNIRCSIGRTIQGFCVRRTLVHPLGRHERPLPERLRLRSTAKDPFRRP